MKETGKWEDRTLGVSEEHAARVPEAGAELDAAMELQLISIRLQKGLIDQLKEIASYHGVGYQPMIRDLLNRFAQSEGRQILTARLAALEQQGEPESTPPVASFMRQRSA